MSLVHLNCGLRATVSAWVWEYWQNVGPGCPLVDAIVVKPPSTFSLEQGAVIDPWSGTTRHDLTVLYPCRFLSSIADTIDPNDGEATLSRGTGCGRTSVLFLNQGAGTCRYVAGSARRDVAVDRASPRRSRSTIHGEQRKRTSSLADCPSCAAQAFMIPRPTGNSKLCWIYDHPSCSVTASPPPPWCTRSSRRCQSCFGLSF